MEARTIARPHDPHRAIQGLHPTHRPRRTADHRWDPEAIGHHAPMATGHGLTKGKREPQGRFVGCGRGWPGGAATATQDVGGHDEVAIGVERAPVPMSPRHQPLSVTRAGLPTIVAVPGQRVLDEHGIVGGRVPGPPGSPGDGHVRRWPPRPRSMADVEEPTSPVGHPQAMARPAVAGDGPTCDGPWLALAGRGSCPPGPHPGHPTAERAASQQAGLCAGARDPCSHHARPGGSNGSPLIQGGPVTGTHAQVDGPQPEPASRCAGSMDETLHARPGLVARCLRCRAMQPTTADGQHTGWSDGCRSCQCHESLRAAVRQDRDRAARCAGRFEQRRAGPAGARSGATQATMASRQCTRVSEGGAWRGHRRSAPRPAPATTIISQQPPARSRPAAAGARATCADQTGDAWSGPVSPRVAVPAPGCAVAARSWGTGTWPSTSRWRGGRTGLHGWTGGSATIGVIGRPGQAGAAASVHDGKGFGPTPDIRELARPSRAPDGEPDWPGNPS